MIKDEEVETPVDVATLAEKVILYERLMNNFCDRVERGEARSRKTYLAFCEALGRENKLYLE